MGNHREGYSKEYYLEHREKILQKRKLFYQNNREKILNLSPERRAKKNAYNRRYNAENNELTKELRRIRSRESYLRKKKRSILRSAE